MAKTKLKNYWILVVLIIVANIIIFKFASKRLETYVINSTLDSEAANRL